MGDNMEGGNQTLQAEPRPQGTAKRQIAYKVRIGHILHGPYVKGEGWTPNYVSVGELKVSRANIIGVVFSLNDDGTILIDDGTGKITLRSFEQDKTFNVSIGDVALVIGRPREFSTERYMIPEIVKKIDPLWAKVREKELNDLKIDEFVPAVVAPEPVVKSEVAQDVEVESIGQDAENTENVVNPCDVLVAKIRHLDDGTGANFEDILADPTIKDAESLVRKLLEEGDIFEIKPGKFKVLE